MISTIAHPCQASFRSSQMSVRATMAEAAPLATAAAVDRRKSLYEVLRVKQNASQVEIKTAYRTLAKLYHPDAAWRFRDSATASAAAAAENGKDFIEIHEAYETLSDPDARAVYDLKMRVGSQRWPYSGTVVRSSGGTRFNSTRRWETDQCW